MNAEPEYPNLNDQLLELTVQVSTLLWAAKRGTEHQSHEGGDYPYPHRRLICGCGEVLVGVAP